MFMKFHNTRVFESKITVGEFYAILREDFVINFSSCVTIILVPVITWHAR